MRGWTLLFAALTAVLGVALVLQLRENRRLRDALAAMAAAKARAAGIEAGQALGPITLRTAAGQDVRVEFSGGGAGTVLLFHASSCDACAATRPHWRNALEQAARPDVRVLCIQTDGAEGGPLSLEGLPASLAVPLPPLGWLAALPAVPATFVVDGGGTVVRSWYGELDGGTAGELSSAIVALPVASGAAR